MVKRSIVWTKTAVKQRRIIFIYWTKRNNSPLYAQKLLKQINIRLKVIITNPTSGIKTSISKVRMSSLGHFSLFYKVENDQIIVVGFWDNRQDPEKIKSTLQHST